jgi:predicted metalloprotease with PDZ domain
MYNNQSQNTHDVICSHLYQNGYLKGLYADLIVRMQFQNQSKQPVQSSIDGIMFKLHKIIAVRSPLLQKLLSDQENAEYLYFDVVFNR